jgi:hypothetical protein
MEGPIELPLGIIPIMLGLRTDCYGKFPTDEMEGPIELPLGIIHVLSVEFSAAVRKFRHAFAMAQDFPSQLQKILATHSL